MDECPPPPPSTRQNHRAAIPMTHAELERAERLAQALRSRWFRPPRHERVGDVHIRNLKRTVRGNRRPRRRERGDPDLIEWMAMWQ